MPAVRHHRQLCWRCLADCRESEKPRKEEQFQISQLEGTLRVWGLSPVRNNRWKRIHKGCEQGLDIENPAHESGGMDMCLQGSFPTLPPTSLLYSMWAEGLYT